MPLILVVDDSAATRHSLVRILEHEGYATANAANGRDAWSTLYAARPQLVILDLMMPQMDGLTFLRLLRQSDHWNDVPVLVMSGHTDQEKLVRRARALGVEDVLAKGGVTPEALLEHVRRIAPIKPRQSRPARPATPARNNAPSRQEHAMTAH